MKQSFLRNTIKPTFDILFRQKKYRKMWGGAFNGQDIRRKIFKDIIKYCDVKEIYESGSFRGTTTLYMQENSGLKVTSVESQTEFYRYSKMRFLFNPNIKAIQGDSRKKFRELIQQDTPDTIFFYLDAHWRDDLPLGEEIKIIFGQLSNAVLLVDDFKVENDPGYTYDDYGPGKALTLEYVKQNIGELPHTFFPISSDKENGTKRGCVVLTNNPATAQKLTKSQYLYKYK